MFNSNLLESLDFTESVMAVLTKETTVKDKINSIKSDIEGMKTELAKVEKQLIESDALLLAGKKSFKENDTEREKLDIKRNELEFQIRTQSNNLQSATRALEIVQKDLQNAREKAAAEAVKEFDEFMLKHKTKISELVDDLLNEVAEAREVFIKRSKITGDYNSSNTLVQFHDSRLPEIMKIVEALKSIGESEIIVKLLYSRV